MRLIFLICKANMLVPLVRVGLLYQFPDISSGQRGQKAQLVFSFSYQLFRTVNFERDISEDSFGTPVHEGIKIRLSDN